MNVEQDALEALARSFLRIHQGNARAAAALRQGNTEDAARDVEEARGIAWRGMQAAIRAGATRPPELPMRRRETTLAQMTSPANRRLLAALRAAVEAAEEVDRERGDYPDGFAEVLGHYAATIAQEVHGPEGGDRE